MATTTPGEVGGIVVGCVVAIALGCTLVGCKTHAKDMNTDSRVRHVMWGATVVSSLAAAFVPATMLIVGIALIQVVGPALIAVGGAILAIVCALAGPHAYDMDATAGTFRITVYWALVIPAHTEYQLADIAGFSMASSRSPKGRLLHSMQVHMRDSRTLPLENGASNVALEARQQLLVRLNRLLVKVTGPTTTTTPEAAIMQMSSVPTQSAVPAAPVMPAEPGYLLQPAYPGDPSAALLPPPPQPQPGSVLTLEQQAMMAQEHAAYLTQQSRLAQPLVVMESGGQSTAQEQQEASRNAPPVYPQNNFIVS